MLRSMYALQIATCHNMKRYNHTIDDNDHVCLNCNKTGYVSSVYLNTNQLPKDLNNLKRCNVKEYHTIFTCPDCNGKGIINYYDKIKQLNRTSIWCKCKGGAHYPCKDNNNFHAVLDETSQTKQFYGTKTLLCNKCYMVINLI